MPELLCGRDNETEQNLAKGGDRHALKIICDLRSQFDALFVELLVGHWRETLVDNSSPELTPSQMQDIKDFFDQILDNS